MSRILGDEVRAHLDRISLIRPLGYVFLLFCVVYISLKNDVYFDDAFITLAYSRNLAAGEGMVYRPGEAVLGTTTPLWCWLNALPFLVIDAERLGSLGCRLWFMVATLGAAIGIARLARRGGFGHWGLLGAAGYVLQPAHHILFGSEVSLAVWLACEGLVAFSRGRALGAGLLAGLLILTRPEAGCLAALLFIGFVIGHRAWHHPVRFLIGSAIILIPALAYLTHAFGSPLPNTLAAKQAQLGAGGHTPWAISMGLGTWRFIVVEWLRGPFLPAFLSVLGVIWIGRSSWDSFRSKAEDRLARCAFFLAFVWGIVHVAALTTLGIAFYRWYLYPLWLAVMLALSAGAAASWRWMQERAASSPESHGRPTSLPGAVAVAIVIMLLIGWQARWTGDPPSLQRERHHGYVQLAAKMEALAAGQPAEVLAYEVGALGFHLPNNISVLDEFYLVRPMPEDRKLPTRDQLIAQARPRFIVETLPIRNDLTQEARAEMMARTAPSFRLFYPTGVNNRTIAYLPVDYSRNAYGLQILFDRDIEAESRMP